MMRAVAYHGMRPANGITVMAGAVPEAAGCPDRDGESYGHGSWIIGISRQRGWTYRSRRASLSNDEAE